MKRLAGLFLITIALASCEKNGDTAGGSRLKRIISGGLVNSEYFYNENGNLSRITLGQKNETLFSYDSQNRLTKIEVANDLSSGMTPQIDYSYGEQVYDTNGRLIKTKNYLKINNAYQFVSSAIPEYDGFGNVISVTVLLPSDQPSKKFTYTYNLAGNVISSEFYQYNGSLQLTQKYIYEYDDKKNPYINIGVIPYSVNKNNITKTTLTNYAIIPGQAVTTITTTTYKSYTANGYPKVVNENGTGEYIYEYE